MPRLRQGQASLPLFELARVLVRLDHVARIIVNATQRHVSDCETLRSRLHHCSRRSNNRVTLAVVFINNSKPPRGVQLVETLIMYENKTHVLLNRPRSAELDWNRCIRSHAWLTTDVRACEQ